MKTKKSKMPRRIKHIAATVVQTQYIGPTNNHGARVTAKNFISKKRVTIPYDYEGEAIDVHAKAAAELLGSGTLMASEDGGNGFFFVKKGRSYLK